MGAASDRPFEIGIIVKPHGISGEVRALPTTDEPERFSLLGEVSVCFEGKLKKIMKIDSVKISKGMVILQFAGIGCREDAAALIGGVMKIPPEKALPLGENEYYIRDLIDMEALNEQGVTLGVVADVLKTGANDVYLIKTPDGGELLLPAIKECILNVSTGENKMTVRLMEGLS
ncbi:MAG: ribosome maturation factor RimM [Defluviitaleaceae bacterium]|nr:ribosome maturation factor RimM [Defluviitaleaceae bacterium]